MPRYDEDFFRDRSGSRRSAEVVVPLVLSLVEPSSVVDVGCGTGGWLAVFRDNGVEDVLGIDGGYVPRDALEIPASAFEPRDLAEPFSFDRRFDLAMSLEVAEHLPESAASGFVASLTALSDVVLFSAAIPGQYGEHHVNEQWQGWWADIFAAEGYDAVDCVRSRIWRHPELDYWYAQNTLLYVRREELARRPALLAQHELIGTEQLSIVHPTGHTLWGHVGWRERLRRRFGAASAPGRRADAFAARSGNGPLSR